jgi:hypothetical protein
MYDDAVDALILLNLVDYAWHSKQQHKERVCQQNLNRKGNL